MLDIIQRRKSIRSYIDRTLDSEIKSQIEQILTSRQAGFFGHTARFVLVEKDTASKQEKVKLGTYGFIKGARYFIAGAMQHGPLAEVDYGYIMEGIVLEMTRLGLGTCWLGGTFSRKEYAQVLHLDESHWIPAILALGYAKEKRGAMDKLVRWGAKGDKRLHWSRLFFEGDFSKPLEREAAGDYAEVLEAVRIGPSASNKQPWRILKDERGLHLILNRTPGYRKWSASTDLQQLDAGIAMCHFETSAKELGLKGRWEKLEMTPPPSNEDELEYIVSWVVEG